MRKAEIDLLWNQFVIAKAEQFGLSYDVDRLQLACQVLEVMRKLYETAIRDDDEESALKNFADGRVVWKLIAIEMASWLIQPRISSFSGSITSRDSWKSSKLNALTYVLSVQTNMFLGDLTDCIDPEVIIMPRWIAQDVMQAAEALQQGEVQDIFKPVKTNRKGKVWSLDQARIRAVQHAEFLVGKGYTVTAANDEVGYYLGVPSNTIRDWKTDYSKDWLNGQRIIKAQEAGQIDTMLSRESDGGHKESKSLDADAYEILLDMKKEPLKNFAVRYKKFVGKRHNP